MTIKRWIVLFGAVLFMLLTGALFLNWLGGGLLFQVAENIVASRTLSCEQIPESTKAEAVVAGQKPLLDSIEAVNPDFVSVHVLPEEQCPGKAILTITYATERDREAIEAILRNSPSNTRPAPWEHPRILGIPYRLVNT